MTWNVRKRKTYNVHFTFSFLAQNIASRVVLEGVPHSLRYFHNSLMVLHSGGHSALCFPRFIPPDDCRKASLVVHFVIIHVRVRAHFSKFGVVISTFIGLSFAPAPLPTYFLKTYFALEKIISSLTWLFELTTIFLYGTLFGDT